MSTLVCPYCRVEVCLSSGEALICEGCQTPHHADCYAENAGCTIFGCSKAPTEEPRLQVSLPEVAGVSIAPAQFLPGTSPTAPGADAAPRVYLNPYYREIPKSRVTYALLGFFFGCFGVHNFYAGHARRAVFQLCLTLFSFFYLAVVSWVWALVEICIVKTDGDGLAFS